MNRIIFITSLSLSDLYNNKLNRSVEDNYKNVIASTSFFDSSISIDGLVKVLSERYLETNDIYIINVSWLNSSNLSVGNRIFEYKNIYGLDFKINYLAMAYTTFFNCIKNISALRSIF